MKLDNHIKALIAVGAAVSANCQPCLQKTVAIAIESGADEHEIAQAVEVGKQVRQGAASKMDQFVVNLNHTILLAAKGECGCYSTEA